MAQSRTQQQQEGYAVWLWLWLTTFAIGPRLVILAFWVFGSQLGDAFSSWVIPVLGFVIAPCTTVAYAFMWSISSDGVNGWEWLVVAVGVLLDLWTWGAMQRLRGR